MAVVADALGIDRSEVTGDSDTPSRAAAVPAAGARACATAILVVATEVAVVKNVLAGH